jgi:hypothetical protein
VSHRYDDDGQKREPSRKEERKKRANVGKSGGGTQVRDCADFLVGNCLEFRRDNY